MRQLKNQFGQVCDRIAGGGSLSKMGLPAAEPSPCQPSRLDVTHLPTKSQLLWRLNAPHGTIGHIVKHDANLILGSDLLPLAERRAAARLLLWGRVTAVLSGTVLSLAAVLAALSRLL